MDSAQPSEVNGSTTSNVETAAPTQNTAIEASGADGFEEPPFKRAKLDDSASSNGQTNGGVPPRVKGIAPIKAKYVSFTPIANCCRYGC